MLPIPAKHEGDVFEGIEVQKEGLEPIINIKGLLIPKTQYQIEIKINKSQNILMFKFFNTLLTPEMEKQTLYFDTDSIFEFIKTYDKYEPKHWSPCNSYVILKTKKQFELSSTLKDEKNLKLILK